MAHAWRFARIGGFDQVRIETGADLASLGELDQKLWVALACPVKGLEIDERTLALIDGDGDGRIHAAELISSSKWATTIVKDADLLIKGKDGLPLSAFGESDDAKLIKRTAKEILRGLDKADATSISVDDTKEAVANFDKEPFNGDGVLPPESVTDEKLRAVADDLMKCVTAKDDRSGKKGFDTETLEGFFKELGEHVEWLDAGAADDATRPLGDDSPAAFEAIEKVRAKIDDFFARRKVAAYDPRALAAVNREETEYLALAAKDMNVTASEVLHFPIAQVAVGKPLPLKDTVNPAWADAMDALRAKVVVPLLGERVTLEEAQWRELCARFEAHAKWKSAEKGASVGALGPERVREIASSDAKAKLEALVAKDKDEEPAAKAIESVEKIVRYARDLVVIVRNFVNFDDFYARDRSAAFQAGRLFFDERECELCIGVESAAAHAAMAPRSSCYLLYCDLTNAKGDKRSVVAAITQGDVDNILVGRNGLFYDRKGGDWAAKVTKIVENPISVRQAFWTPYKRILRFIEEQIEKRAADADKASSDRLDAGLAEANTAASTSAATGAAPPAPTEPRKIDVGMVAAIGVAVGGLVAALGALLEAFFGLGAWMPLGVIALMLLISAPSMAVAWLKLRKRNLGPLLDANGWAVNAQARVNVPMGEKLTKTARLPPGSARELHDPYAEKKRPWWLYVTLLLVLGGAIAWWIGKLDAYLPEPARSTAVLGELAPAYEAPEDESGAEEETPAEEASTAE